MLCQLPAAPLQAGMGAHRARLPLGPSPPSTTRRAHHDLGVDAAVEARRVDRLEIGAAAGDKHGEARLGRVVLLRVRQRRRRRVAGGGHRSRGAPAMPPLLPTELLLPLLLLQLPLWCRRRCR